MRLGWGFGIQLCQVLLLDVAKLSIEDVGPGSSATGGLFCFVFQARRSSSIPLVGRALQMFADNARAQGRQTMDVRPVEDKNPPHFHGTWQEAISRPELDG